jgi:hypothetical protein
MSRKAAQVKADQAHRDRGWKRSDSPEREQLGLRLVGT